MTARDALSSFTASRPVAVLMVFVAAVVFGYFSYDRLAVKLMPELSYPSVTVRTEYPGAAPEEVEKDVSQPIEEALGVIGGLRRLSSVSRAGVSDVTLEFSWKSDMSEAVQDALERLDLVQLPEEAESPLILRYDPTLDPIMELSLTSARKDADPEHELRRLRRIAELQVKRALEPIEGVAAVRVRGGLEEEIHVVLDPGSLARAGISIDRVISRLAEENINVAGGTLEEGRTDYLVRTLNEYQDTGEIADTVVQKVDGREIRIKDLGEVVRSHEERKMITRVNGKESVRIEIFKEADANIVALAKRVRATLGDLEEAESGGGGGRARRARAGGGPRGPPGRMRGPQGLAPSLLAAEQVKLEVESDRSGFIESSIDEVRNTAVLGGLLAVLVLFLFLRNLKSTLIVAVSIPVSVLVTFAPLNLFGVSLNIMSLGGLALGIGMLVDSSIVVLESIFRCREEGDDVVTATVRGTREVRSAVVASILTTIGVFLPMVFVEGVAGQAFGDLGLAVVLSLTASLVVALFLIPMLASRRGLDLGGGDRTASWLKSFGAWRAFRGDLRALSWPLRLALGPYLCVRLVIAAVLELFAKLLLLAFLGPLWLVRRFFYPWIAAAFRLLWWLPLAAADRSLRGLDRAYPRLLRWALSHAPAVLALTAACTAATIGIIRSLDSELLPEVHQGEFTVELALPVGTPLEQTDAILKPVESAILAEGGRVESLLVTLG